MLSDDHFLLSSFAPEFRGRAPDGIAHRAGSDSWPVAPLPQWAAGEGADDAPPISTLGRKADMKRGQGEEEDRDRRNQPHLIRRRRFDESLPKWVVR